jgi:hypothetical protein
MKYGFDSADQAVFDLEELADLPSPIDVRVIEERESEGDPAFPIDGNEAAIADPRTDIAQRPFARRLPRSGEMGKSRRHRRRRGSFAGESRAAGCVVVDSKFVSIVRLWG